MCVLQFFLPLISNLIVTATTNEFDLIKFELEFMSHSGGVGANIFFSFFLYL